ncbi:MAG TPA: D-sedoheptulose 7-phosphate isomerase [Rhodoferax sp.]
MKSTSIFLRNINEHQAIISKLNNLDEVVLSAIIMISDSLRSGGKVMLCGNGGSAADSQHLAAEFTGRFIKDRPPLAAFALSTDSSALTCIGNDYSFSEIFSRQVIALGKPGDCLIGISTSGNSENVVKAMQAAIDIGIHTIGLLGRDGGKLSSMCECSIIVPSNVTARIQETHILIGHTICGGVEQNLGLVPSMEA